MAEWRFKARFGWFPNILQPLYYTSAWFAGSGRFCLGEKAASHTEEDCPLSTLNFCRQIWCSEKIQLLRNWLLEHHDEGHPLTHVGAKSENTSVTCIISNMKHLAIWSFFFPPSSIWLMCHLSEVSCSRRPCLPAHFPLSGDRDRKERWKFIFNLATERTSKSSLPAAEPLCFLTRVLITWF